MRAANPDMHTSPKCEIILWTNACTRHKSLRICVYFPFYNTTQQQQQQQQHQKRSGKKLSMEKCVFEFVK
jgi:hypothetical protein